MYTTGTVARQEALIIRLQKELTDVQRCNHALNSQLQSFKSKKEVVEAKKELKERQKECDNLRKKNQKFEFDKQQWEGNLPVDVQLLLSQKRELTNQLNREQIEKEELLAQMNVFIGQLAESAQGDSLREENKILKKKLQDQEAVTTAESRRLTDELQKVRENAEIEGQTLRLERKKLQAEVEDVKKELSIKSAAFQSLMLAKQDTSKDEQFKKMTEEMTALKEAIRKLDREKQDVADELEAKQIAEKSMKNEHEVLTNEINRLKELLREESEKIVEVEKHKQMVELQLVESTAEIESFDLKLSQHEHHMMSSEREKNDIIRNREEQIRSLKEKNDELEVEIEQKTDENYELKKTLLNKDTIINTTRIDFLAVQSKAAQLEEEKMSLENQIKNTERQITQLHAQVNSNGNEEKELLVLREELKKANEHSTLIENRLQKATSQQNTADTYRQETEELKAQIEKLQQENATIDSLKAEISSNMEKIIVLTKSERELREKYQKLEGELDDSKNSKVSVADEINTLMKSINSLRKQIDENDEDIRNLEKERNDLNQYIEDVNEEMNGWREQAESVLIEKEQLEKELKYKTENMLLLTSASSSSKNDYDKLEAREKALISQIDELQERNKDLEEELDGTKAEMSQICDKAGRAEKQSENLGNLVQQLEEEKEEAEQKFDQQLKHVQQELLNAKKRNEELEEERVRSVGSSDSEKKRLLEEAKEQREKATSALSKVSTLEEDVSLISTSLTMEKAKSHMLESKLQKFEMDLAEAVARAELAASVEDEKRKLEQQNLKLKKEVEKLEEQLKETHGENEMKIGLFEKQIGELKSSREMSEAEKQEMAEKIEEIEKMGRKIADLETKLATSNERQQQNMLNLKNMTELLESESKRFQEAAQEKRRFKERAEEAERLLAENKENPQQNDDTLITENARLASELLKTRSQNEEIIEEERGQVAKQYEEKLKNLSAQLATSTSRIEELNRTIVQTEKKRKDEVASVYDELQMVKNENSRLQVKIDEMYNSNRLAPSRRVSNMSSITNFSTTDFSEIEDVDILREQIDKQKRLIIVLRRKCQGLK